jgi:hypothetical protein
MNAAHNLCEVLLRVGNFRRDEVTVKFEQNPVYLATAFQLKLEGLCNRGESISSDQPGRGGEGPEDRNELEALLGAPIAESSDDGACSLLRIE